MLKFSYLQTSGDGRHSAFECLISEMRRKTKLKLILFDSYILVNYRKMTKGKA